MVPAAHTRYHARPARWRSAPALVRALAPAQRPAAQPRDALGETPARAELACMNRLGRGGQHAFTYAGYRQLLGALAERGYVCGEFEAIEELHAARRPFVLLRHDIDMDLGLALRMARLEASAGARATYFVMVRTDHYNVFSREGSEAIREILRLGHRLGLHFDAAAYDRTTAGGAGIDAAASEAATSELAACVRQEARLLADWFATPLEVVSFHRPGPHVLTGDPALAEPFWHTYMRCFTEEVTYFSDSGGAFRYGHPLDSQAFAEGRPLHLLTHPVWWNSKAQSPGQSLRGLVRRKQEQFKASLAANCRVKFTEEANPAG